MDRHVLATIFRRWIAGQSISLINEQEGFDRKTVRTDIKGFEAHGYRHGQEEMDPEQLDRLLDELVPNNQRQRSKREQLEPHQKEPLRLVNPAEQSEDALKPKPPFSCSERSTVSM